MNSVALFEDSVYRIRDFKIYITGDWQWFTPCLLEMTRCTKSMQLEYGYRPQLSGPPYGGNLVDIPDNLPEIQLDSLSLCSVSLPWSCSLYRGLSKLHLSNEVNESMKPLDTKLSLVYCPLVMSSKEKASSSNESGPPCRSIVVRPAITSPNTIVGHPDKNWHQ